ncbi:hypothetical protein V6N13_019634 [Hibiscus sabdariffa]|uniref:CCHC-type domain-containing protein n=1 Tax=Hibiscus sabdariffa TaxID=183260 RepID=A0ABR2EK25_9ROSI
MPATAGRVRMPANNRVHSSAALQTHGIWQSAIGYDPYAPNKDDSKNSSSQVTAAAEPDGENAYASFQGLLALARITGSNADEARGACRKCGRVGHLTFQCKNFVSLKESKEKDPDAIQAAVLNGLDKLKGGKVNGKKEMESESEDEESQSSDSDVDSEIERIIAERSGKKVTRKGRKSSKKKKSDEDDSSDSDDKERKKRGRSKKRSSRKRGISDSDDEGEGRRKRRKEKRKKRDESSDEEDDHRRHRKRKSRKEKRRRRSHRHSDDSESSDVSDYSGVQRGLRRGAGNTIMKMMSRGLLAKGFKRVDTMLVLEVDVLEDKII